MLIHLETKGGTPACGSQKPDPDLTSEPQDVTCKRCLDSRLDVRQTAATDENTTRNEDTKLVPRRGRSNFLTYEEVRRLCAKARDS